MPEVASVFQAARVGVESPNFTAVAANKQLRSIGFKWEPKPEIDIHRSDGQKHPSLAVYNGETADWKMNGKATYDELVYALVPFFGLPTDSVPAAGVAKRVFTMAGAAEDAIKTLTIDSGSGSYWNKSAGCFGKSFKLSISRQNGTPVEGDFIGKRIQHAGAPSDPSPTTLPLVPIAFTHWDIYMASTYAGLAGATALSRQFAFEFGLNNKGDPLRPIRSTVTDFDGVAETAPETMFNLTMAADGVGRGVYDDLRTTTVRFFRAKAVGPIISGSDTYSLEINAAVNWKAAATEDSNGIFAYNFQGVPIDNATVPGDGGFEIILQNSVETL